MDGVDQWDELEFGAWEPGGASSASEKAVQYPSIPKRLANAGPDGKKKSNKHISHRQLEEMLLRPVSLRGAKELHIELENKSGTAKAEAASMPVPAVGAAPSSGGGDTPTPPGQTEQRKKRTANALSAPEADVAPPAEAGAQKKRRGTKAGDNALPATSSAPGSTAAANTTAAAATAAPEVPRGTKGLKKGRNAGAAASEAADRRAPEAAGQAAAGQAAAAPAGQLKAPTQLGPTGATAAAAQAAPPEPRLTAKALPAAAPNGGSKQREPKQGAKPGKGGAGAATKGEVEAATATATTVVKAHGTTPEGGAGEGQQRAAKKARVEEQPSSLGQQPKGEGKEAVDATKSVKGKQRQAPAQQQQQQQQQEERGVGQQKQKQQGKRPQHPGPDGKGDKPATASDGERKNAKRAKGPAAAAGAAPADAPTVAPAPAPVPAAASLAAALGGRAAAAAAAAATARVTGARAATNSGPTAAAATVPGTAPAAAAAAPPAKLTHAAALAALQRKAAAAAAAAAAGPGPLAPAGGADSDSDDGGAPVGRKGKGGKAAAVGGGGGFLDRMRARLAGGRFRYLNEELYTRSGDDAFAMMQAQPELFSQYHDGFQKQTRGWPKQPVDVAISWLRAKKSEIHEVADFGCGDARIAASVPQTVHSFDLVASAPGVVACNMADVPLADGQVDAAVFSLALMGTDYGSYLEEAVRVLKPKGWLWIAEVRSRFAKVDTDEEEDDGSDAEDDRGAGGKGARGGRGGGGDGGGGGDEDFGPFLACLKRLGLRLVSQDAHNKMFVVWVLRKEETGGKAAKAGGKGGRGIQWPPLKACVYKKR